MRKSVSDRALSLLFVQKCSLCGKRIVSGAMCPSCLNKLKFIGKNFCRKCAKEQNKCTCGKVRRSFRECTAVLEFNTAAKSLIYKIKNKGDKETVRFLSCLMAQRVKRDFKKVHFDDITFVPSSLQKRFSNGFCHAALLAKDISEELDIPFVSPPIVRKNLSKKQKKISSLERRNNAGKSYIYKKRKMGETVLLVDDVITTGSTLEACAKLIKRAGAKSVYCILGAAADK